MSQAFEGKPEAQPGNDLGNDNGQENGSGTGQREQTTITAVTINTEADCMLKGCVNGVSASILVDTGAAATILSKKLWNRTGCKTPLTSSDGQKLVSVQGIPLHLHGGTQIELQLKDELFSVRVMVADTLTTGVDVILGRDFLRDHRCTIEMGEKRDTLHFKDRSISFILNGQELPLQATQVHVLLSRHPCTQCGRASHSEEPTPDVIAAEQQVPPVLVQKPPDELRRIQLEDGPVGLMLRAVEKMEKPTSEDARGHGPEAQRLKQLWTRLIVDDGVLKRRYKDTQKQSTWLQLVVPCPLRDEVLHELHAGALEGHLGEDKTLNKVKERFYWPGMQHDVRNWCRTCEACQTRKSAPKKNHAPLQTIKAGFPMQVVAVDIMGPLPESETGNKYVLVASDYFTKWTEVYAIPNQEATTVAQKLTDEMFCRFSPPEQLHSDQGRQFESRVVHEVCKLLKIRKTKTTPYHPQCDGQVERFNRTLLDMLATTTRENAFDWENQIRKVCMAYNTSVHSSTGFTPFFLMFGRQAKTD